MFLNDYVILAFCIKYCDPSCMRGTVLQVGLVYNNYLIEKHGPF